MRKAARDVDALLFAPRKRGGRQRPEPIRDVQPGQKAGRPCLRLLFWHAECQERFGHHINRGHARHDAEELADIAQGFAAEPDDLARGGGGDIERAHPYGAGGGKVIAPDHPHQRGLARARSTDQPDTFAGRDRQRRPGHDGDYSRALVVQGEAFGQIFNLDHFTPAGQS